jgi:hypothetical protein
VSQVEGDPAEFSGLNGARRDVLGQPAGQLAVFGGGNGAGRNSAIYGDGNPTPSRLSGLGVFDEPQVWPG